MKKYLICSLIIGVITFNSCKWSDWCCKKTGGEKQSSISPDNPFHTTSLKELEQRFLNLNRKLEAKLDLKKKDTNLINLQKTIEKKANIANAKIKKLVQADKNLKNINNQIIIKKQQLNDKKIEKKLREKIQKEIIDLIAQFKQNDQYKKEIEPLELAVKNLSQKYNTINLAHNTQIKKLVGRKKMVMTQIKKLKK
jgi:hypothetical protein